MASLAPLTLRHHQSTVMGNQIEMRDWVLEGTQIGVSSSGTGQVSVSRITGRAILPDYGPRSGALATQRLRLALEEVAQDPSTAVAMSATLSWLWRTVQEHLYQTQWSVDETMIYLSYPDPETTLSLQVTGVQYVDGRLTVRDLRGRGEQWWGHLRGLQVERGAMTRVRMERVSLRPSQWTTLPRWKLGPLTHSTTGTTSWSCHLHQCHCDELQVTGLQIRQTPELCHLGWQMLSVHQMAEVYLPSPERPWLQTRHATGEWTALQPLEVRIGAPMELRAWCEQMARRLQDWSSRLIRPSGGSSLSVSDLASRVRCGPWQMEAQLARGEWGNGKAWGLRAVVEDEQDGYQIRMAEGGWTEGHLRITDLCLQQRTVPEPATLSLEEVHLSPSQIRVRGGTGTRIGRLLRWWSQWPARLGGQGVGTPPAVRVEDLHLHRPLGRLGLHVQVHLLTVTPTGCGESLSSVRLGDRELGTWRVRWSPSR